MSELRELKNIGKEIEKQLFQAGINTCEQLRKTGSKRVWLAIRDFDPSACYNRLCALEGAIRGVRWFDLDDEVKRDLKGFYRTVTGSQ